MANANVQRILQDPNFHVLDPDTKQAVMSQVDPAFAGMDDDTQKRIVFGLQQFQPDKGVVRKLYDNLTGNGKSVQQMESEDDSAPESDYSAARLGREYGVKPYESIKASAGQAASLLAFPVAAAVDAYNGDDSNKAALSQSIDDFTQQKKGAAPDERMGFVGHMVRGVEELAPLIAAGPAGLSVMAAEGTAGAGIDLLDKGVGAGTAGVLGAVSGAMAPIMGAIPLAGNAFKSIAANYGAAVAKGIGVNVGLGIAGRAIYKGVLSANGYDQQAEDTKILDLSAMAHEAAMGVLFGAHQQYGAPKGKLADQADLDQFLSTYVASQGIEPQLPDGQGGFVPSPSYLKTADMWSKFFQKNGAPGKDQLQSAVDAMRKVMGGDEPTKPPGSTDTEATRIAGQITSDGWKPPVDMSQEQHDLTTGAAVDTSATESAINVNSAPQSSGNILDEMLKGPPVKEAGPANKPVGPEIPVSNEAAPADVPSVQAVPETVPVPVPANQLTPAAVDQEITHLSSVAAAKKAEALNLQTRVANGELDPKQAQPLIALSKARAKAADDAVKAHQDSQQAINGAATGETKDGATDTLPELPSAPAVDGTQLPVSEVQSQDVGQGSDDAQPTGVVTPTAVDVAAHEAATSPNNDTPSPTPAQADAGNYRMGHVNVHGLDISIENPQGSTRSGVDANGKPWSTPMQSHYGYIKGTVGKDKEHVDVFIKPGTDPAAISDKVFVVDQVNPGNRSFDEHKVMMGFDSLPEAKAAYLSNYDQTGPSRIGDITEATAGEFKQWLSEGDTSQRFADAPVQEKGGDTSGENGQRGSEGKESGKNPVESRGKEGELHTGEKEGLLTPEQGSQDGSENVPAPTVKTKLTPEEEADAEFDKALAEVDAEAAAKKPAADPTVKEKQSANKERLKKPKQERTAGEAASDAAAHAKTAYDEGIAAMKEIAAKLKEKRGSFSTKDSEEYAMFKPHLKKMWDAIKAASKDATAALKTFISDVIRDMGRDFLPHAKEFYREVKAEEAKPVEVEDAAKVEPIGDIKDIAQHIPQIAERILPMLREGKDFSGKLTRLAAGWYDVKQSEILTGTRTKTLQEAAELAVVQRAREITADKSLDADAKFEAVNNLYDIQPILGERTSTSMANQAYSTPAPISFAMQEFLDLLTHPKLNVYEPTAGTGMLVFAANPNSVSANEIGVDRLSALKAQGLYEITTDDGRRHIANVGAEGTFSRVIANPPFGKTDTVSANGFPLSKIEHQIMADALSGMTDGGKSVFIIGGHNFKDGQMNGTDRVFLNYLYSHYNVAHNIDVNGDVYVKQGTKFPIRVIAIDGRKPVPDDNYAPKQKEVGAYKYANTVDELRALLKGEAVNESKPSDVNNLPELSGRAPGDGTDIPARPNSEQPDRAGDRDGLTPTDNSEVSAKPDRRPDVNNAAAKDTEGADATQAGLPTGNDSGGTDSELDRLKEESPTNQHQVPYVAKSKGPSGYTLVPKNVAESLKEALDRIAESNGGDLDEFVRKELQYDSIPELFKSYAAEQIDALAMSLHNMKIGKGMIIGDMTGIGKGRVVAGIIRHTLLNGKIPIFVTEKPKLFSDMWRDLVDIGTEDRVNPLLMASSTDGHIVNENGEVLQKIDGGKASTPVVYQKLESQGKQALDAMGRNAVFVTYSQFSGSGSRQRRVISALAPDSVIILDEAHNAGGEDAKPTAKNPNPVSIAQFVRGDDVLGAASGVIYSSATFAKRPDNMPLYFRTALGSSGMSPEQLTEVMKRGGVALQQFISAQLTKAGDMIRREQDFSKIARFERKVITADKQRVYDRSDTITEQLRDMMHFAGEMADHFPWDEVATENGQEVTSGDDGSNVGGTDFSSGVHNLIGQIQLSLKADAIVEEALTAIKEGYKPVIGLMNTMESFLNDYAEQTGLKKGDTADFSFNDVLIKMLNNGLRYNVRDARGVTTKHYATEEQLERFAPDLHIEYRRIKSLLADLPLSDMPASPIDYIKQKIADAGHTIREITGRNTVITDGELTARDDKDRNTSVNGFNNGPVSALLINRAGATGLSLHPTAKTGDKRPRRMIIAQADLNIDTFVQMLGRIFRKGQIHDPEYIMLSTALPSETRPAIVVEKKMQSMNANTSANDKSGFSSDIPDMVNQYGDQVVANWLRQNFSFATALGVDPDSDGQHGDKFKKTTGRMGLMAALDQENFWAEIVDDYKTLIAEKDALGQNDLVAKSYDFKAETVNKTVIHQGSDESNPFTASAVVEEIKATMPGKPYTSAEIVEKINKTLNGKSLAEFKANLLSEMNDKADVFSSEHEDAITKLHAQNPELDEDGHVIDKKWQREKMRALTAIEAVSHNRDTFIEMIRAVDLGKTYQVPFGDETLPAVPFDIRIDSGSGNPLAPSKIKIMYAIPNGNKMLAVGMNRKNVWGDAVLQNRDMVGKEWDDLDGGELRRTRHVITGNVLQGFSALTSRAQLVNFTRDNGTTDQGILLPVTADIGQLTASQTAGPEQVAQYIAGSSNRTARDKGNDITIMSTHRGDAFISVPGSKQRAGKYFLDRDLLSITGDFRKAKGRMTVSFPIAQAGAALARLDAIGARFSIPRQGVSQTGGNGQRLNAHPFTPDQIVSSLSGLKENLQQDIPKLVELGKQIYEKSGDNLKSFMAGMRKYLGDKYEQFKSHILNVYRDVKRIMADERGKVGKDINAEDDKTKGPGKPSADVVADRVDTLKTKIAAASAAKDLAHVWDEIRKGIRPESRSAMAKQMAMALRVSIGSRNRGNDTFAEELNKSVVAEEIGKVAKLKDWLLSAGQTAADKIFSTRTTEEKHAFMQAMDGPATEKAAYFAAHPELEPIAVVIDRMFQEKSDQIRALGTGALKELRETYFPHIWEREENGKDIASRMSKRPIEGSKDFAKHRVFDDVNAGLKAGYKPVSDNPIDLVFLKMHEMDKYLSLHTALQAAERAGGDTVRLVPMGKHADAPAGYKFIDGVGSIERSHMQSPGDDTNIGVGKTNRYRYTAREDVAQILNNYSSKSLYSVKEFGIGKVANIIKATGNTLNRFQLGVLSAFHAGFTSCEAVISHAALGMKAAGNFEFKDAAKYMIEAPAAWYLNPKRGGEILKAWREAGVDGVVPDVVRYLEMAGARFSPDMRFFTNDTQKMVSDWNDGHRVKATLRAPLAFVEQSARPIMEMLVPRQKAGVFGEMADYWVKHNPDATQVETAEAMQQIWNRVDSRLGQVNYERLFANNIAKNLVQLLVRAPGWTGGTLLEVGGGVKDLVKSLVEAPANGGKLNLSDRAAYTLSMLMVTGLSNALLTAACTGEVPNDWRDLFAFRTGNVDEYGNPERFMLPTYMKDLYAYAKDPIGTLTNKAHPLWGLISQIKNNKDYYGVEVRHPDDNFAQQAGETAKFVAKAFVPFWMRGVQKESERDGSALAMAAPLIGIMPATKKLNQTDAEAKASELAAGHFQQRSRTQEEADKSQMKSQIGRSMRLHPGEIPPEATQAMEDGTLTRRSLLSSFKQSRQTPIVNQVNQLTMPEALQVWSKADDDEKEKLRPVMQLKIRRSFGTMPRADFEALRPKLEESGLIPRM